MSRAFTIFYAIFDLAELSAVPSSACAFEIVIAGSDSSGVIGRRAIDGGAPESVACRSKYAIE